MVSFLIVFLLNKAYALWVFSDAIQVMLLYRSNKNIDLLGAGGTRRAGKVRPPASSVIRLDINQRAIGLSICAYIVCLHPIPPMILPFRPQSGIILLFVYFCTLHHTLCNHTAAAASVCQQREDLSFANFKQDPGAPTGPYCTPLPPLLFLPSLTIRISKYKQ